jgi:hypothetical protein
VAPEDEPVEGDPNAALGNGAAAMARRIHERRALEPDDGVGLGSFLFRALIGAETWAAIVTAAGPPTTVLELALRCEGDGDVLRGLAWELMHDGDGFLALHPLRAVAVTRVVRPAGDQPELRQSTRPPKVLFAIGADLDDPDPDIRAGTEFVGLLRALERRGSIDFRLLERASPGRLAQAVQRFDPDVVHVISHGDLDENGDGVLRLRGDGAEALPLAVGADVLGQALRADGRPAPLVVLSASHGGSVGGPHAASLAAALVTAGVPVVIAMSGRVTDRACRLFTRIFGRTLIRGGPLAAAVIDGRRAAYLDGGPPGDTVDWALPALFVSDGVPEGYAPVAPLAEGEQAPDLISVFDLVADPVFCGRREFFEDYERLLDPAEGLQVLAVYTAQRVSGIGKRRLLTELAARALGDGHVPVFVRPSEAAAPRTVRGLAVELLEAIRDVRENLGLDPPIDSRVLRRLCEGTQLEAAAEGDEVDRQVALTELLEAQRDDERPLNPAVLRIELAADLAALAQDVGQPSARVLVLLSGVDSWGDAREALFTTLLTRHGLGTPAEPIPVVLSCALADPLMEEHRKDAAKGTRSGWMEFRQLLPFREDGEDTLAYQWVLLHARPGFSPPLSDHVYVPAGNGEWQKVLRARIKGIPGLMSDETFYQHVDTLALLGLLVADDDDEARLRAYLEQQG